jgi:hypothetical protein
MNDPGWVIKGGYSYGINNRAPRASDVNYPIGSYIWVNTTTNTAHILISVDEAKAVWIVKQPDSIITVAGRQVYVFGESFLGAQVVGSAPGHGSLPAGAVVSTPIPGEYKITNIRLDENKKLVVTHNEEPTQ